MNKKVRLFKDIEVTLKTDFHTFSNYFIDYLKHDNIAHSSKVNCKIIISYFKGSVLSDVEKTKMVRYSSDFYATKNEFLFHAGHNLWLKILFDGININVVVFDEISKLKKNLGKLLHGKSYKFQRYMFIIRQALLLPSFYHHYINLGYVTWHSSALKINNSNIAFTGLNGCGKSGLLLHFIDSYQNSKIISDNYLLIDSNANFMSVPEPIRIDSSNSKEFTFIDKRVCSAFGKHQYKPKSNYLINEGNLDLIFLTRIGNEFNLKELKSDDFAKEMYSLHSFLGETPEQNYFEPIAYIDGKHNLNNIWNDVSKSFCENVKCFVLTIPYEQDTKKRYIKVEEEILKLIK